VSCTEYNIQIYTVEKKVYSNMKVMYHVYPHRHFHLVALDDETSFSCVVTVTLSNLAVGENVLLIYFVQLPDWFPC